METLLPDMQYLNAALSPCSLSAFSIGVLTNANMHGAALFPCHNPCGGGLHGIAQMSPPYESIESLNAVLQLCTMSCSVVNVHCIGSFGIATLCRAIDAMLCTVRL